MSFKIAINSIFTRLQFCIKPILVSITLCVASRHRRAFERSSLHRSIGDLKFSIVKPLKESLNCTLQNNPLGHANLIVIEERAHVVFPTGMSPVAPGNGNFNDLLVDAHPTKLHHLLYSYHYKLYQMINHGINTSPHAIKGY